MKDAVRGSAEVVAQRVDRLGRLEGDRTVAAAAEVGMEVCDRPPCRAVRAVGRDHKVKFGKSVEAQPAVASYELAAKSGSLPLERVHKRGAVDGRVLEAFGLEQATVHI